MSVRLHQNEKIILGSRARNSIPLWILPIRRETNRTDVETESPQNEMANNPIKANIKYSLALVFRNWKKPKVELTNGSWAHWYTQAHKTKRQITILSPTLAFHKWMANTYDRRHTRCSFFLFIFFLFKEKKNRRKKSPHVDQILVLYVFKSIFLLKMSHNAAIIKTRVNKFVQTHTIFIGVTHESCKIPLQNALLSSHVVCHIRARRC